MLLTARRLTRNQLAEATGFSFEIVKQMTREGAIPTTLYTKVDGQYLYDSSVVALLALVRELQNRFGAQSALPREIVRHLGDDIVQAWRDGTPRRLRVLIDNDIEVCVRSLKFVDVAREQLAVLA